MKVITKVLKYYWHSLFKEFCRTNEQCHFFLLVWYPYWCICTNNINLLRWSISDFIRSSSFYKPRIMQLITYTTTIVTLFIAIFKLLHLYESIFFWVTGVGNTPIINRLCLIFILIFFILWIVLSFFSNYNNFNSASIYLMPTAHAPQCRAYCPRHEVPCLLPTPRSAVPTAHAPKCRAYCSRAAVPCTMPTPRSAMQLQFIRPSILVIVPCN